MQGGEPGQNGVEDSGHNGHQKSDPDELSLRQLKFFMIGSELVWSLWGLGLKKGFMIDNDDYTKTKIDSYFSKKAKYGPDFDEMLNRIDS